MDKYIKWVLLLTALAGIGLLAFGCRRKPADTDDIDGGVQHYEDAGAPKVIHSTKIVSFSCQFSAYALSMDSSPVAGQYHTLYAGPDGGRYEARAGGEVREQFTFTPDGAFFDALQQLVADHAFAAYNGTTYTVSGLPPDYGAKLNIQYASGESIYASNNQSCFLPLEATEALVALFLSAKPNS